MVYASYNETMRTFKYTPYENWATRRSKEKLNKPNNEPLLADELILIPKSVNISPGSPGTNPYQNLEPGLL